MLTENDQKNVILSYEKDYGAILMSYNKLGEVKDPNVLRILGIRAENLRKEIINEISPRKNVFNESNLSIVTDIAKSIDNFIKSNFENDKNSNIYSIHNPTSNDAKILPIELRARSKNAS